MLEIGFLHQEILLKNQKFKILLISLRYFLINLIKSMSDKKKESNYLALILARKGSKRLKNKNIFEKIL